MHKSSKKQNLGPSKFYCLLLTLTSMCFTLAAKAECGSQFDFRLSRRVNFSADHLLKIKPKAAKKEKKNLKLNITLEALCDTKVAAKSSRGLVIEKEYKVSPREKLRLGRDKEGRKESLEQNGNAGLDFRASRLDFVSPPAQKQIRLELVSIERLKQEFGTSAAVFEIPVQLKSEKVTINFTLKIENPNPQRLVVPL